MISTRTKLALAGVLSTARSAAQAVPVTYLGSDNGVSSLAQMVNSQAAAADFLSVAGALNSFGFESAIPAALTVSGGTTVNGSSCGALCGFNTTAGGSFHREVFGGSVTFSFANPVDAFGFFVNGLQTNLSVGSRPSSTSTARPPPRRSTSRRRSTAVERSLASSTSVSSSPA